MDFFTASHPFVPFTIGSLSDAIGVYHTNPELYYVPKQNAIGRFNDEYGDALYMIEERAADGHGDQASFGFSDELISTHDLLEKLRKNENHEVDEEVLYSELAELGERFDRTRGIHAFLIHPGFPVDVRHNAKIFREKLAVWAQGKFS